MKKITITYNGKKIKAIHCNIFLTKFLGLMMRKNKSALIVLPGESRLFAMIHTFFMRYSLDIIWLDKKRRIVDIKKDVRPFRNFIYPKKKAKYILEVPAGSIKMNLNDAVQFDS